MRSKGNSPTAAQKRWYDAVASFGCIECGNPAQIHHCVGASAKIKGVGNIGHQFILPLCPEHHAAVHAMGRDRKPYEKQRFADVILSAPSLGADLPPDDVIAAIEGYHR